MWICECGRQDCDGCEEDPPLDIDPYLLYLATTPEGLEWEPVIEPPRLTWQEIEDERAKKAADEAWSNHRKENQRKAA